LFPRYVITWVVYFLVSDNLASCPSNTRLVITLQQLIKLQTILYYFVLFDKQAGRFILQGKNTIYFMTCAL